LLDVHRNRGAASDVDAALSFVPEKERTEPVERGIRRAFHSIADVLERVSGERLGLRGYYQSEKYNPFTIARAGLREWRASLATAVQEEGDGCSIK
jgi:hypothetical protein